MIERRQDMKFYTNDSENVIVWNPDRGKRLCQFKNGEYETEIQEETSILEKIFKYEGQEVKEPTIQEMNLKELRAIAREKGIKGYSRMAKEILLMKLAGD